MGFKRDGSNIMRSLKETFLTGISFFAFMVLVFGGAFLMHRSVVFLYNVGIFLWCALCLLILGTCLYCIEERD